MTGSIATRRRSRGSGSSPGRYSRAAIGSSPRRSRIWRAWPREGRSSVARRVSPHGDIDGWPRESLDSLMPDPPVPLKRWKRVEYERLVDRGAFDPGDRIELIDGLLRVAEPQSSPHYTAIRLGELALSRAFGAG